RLHRRRCGHHLRRYRAAHQPRPRTTPLHPPPTGCPRRTRRRMPLAELRQTTHLGRSPPHPTLETRPRQHQPHRRTTPLPTPPPPTPQQPLGNPSGGLRLLADPTPRHRPQPAPTVNAKQKRRTPRPTTRTGARPAPGTSGIDERTTWLADSPTQPGGKLTAPTPPDKLTAPTPPDGKLTAPTPRHA
ncbi:MAG: hypothetical protein QOF36_2250, partial [Microbacteriaceae bacterium]|nr:hypothetical protein [Microbacteriaceae bacterium]